MPLFVNVVTLAKIYILPKKTQRKKEGGTVINVNPKIEERTKAGIFV